MSLSASSPPDPDRDAWWHIFDPRESLPARAALLGGGLAVAFTLLLGVTAEKLLRRQLEQQLGPSFENLAFQICDKLDHGVYERYRGLLFTADLPAFRLASTPAAERRRLVEALLDSSPDLAWVGFADASGTVVSATQGLFETENVAERPWFRGARRQPFAGDVHEFPELAREGPNPGEERPRFLDLAVPVTAADGKFLGVLAAHVRWSWAREVQLSVVPESARREHLGVTLYAASGETLSDSGASGWTEPPPVPTAATAQRSRGFASESVGGAGVYLTGFARSRGVREFRGLGWLAVVRQPERDAFAPAPSLHRWITRLGLVLAAVAATLAWLAAARFTRRLHAVGAAAHRIGSGDILALMPQPRGRGEVDRMCTALGDMVDAFRRQQEKSEADHTRLAIKLHARETAPTSDEPPNAPKA